ncbi:MAG: amidohydrolase [Bacteroidetes bacterium]|nr:amidohydrolase [Bacteroidota bacterium]
MILRNARRVVLQPLSIQSGDLRIDAGKVVESGSMLVPGAGEEVRDLAGKLLMPGFVCAHTHLYSSLARGMPGPKSPPRHFADILKKVWWRLDRALDEESIYYSALVGAIEALQCGTTTLIDHHASPRFIPGSLDIIREAVERVGLRAALCYEVTDRGGRKQRDQGLEENERFLRITSSHPYFRGLVGAHATFTLSDDSLRLCGQMAERHQTGVHIHVAEDVCDVKDARKKHSKGVVDRLQTHGILNSHSILAHCIHLVPQEFRALRKAQCWLVHNPRSNMNNNVGHAPVHLFGERVALGTDGFPADMFEEARFGFFRGQENLGNSHFRASRKQSPFTRFVSGGHGLVSEIFREKFGLFEQGAVADLVVLDYVPPTPLTKENLLWHFLFGMRSAMIDSVMVGGRWVMKDRLVLGVNTEEACKKASEVAIRLWKRMNG